MRLYEIGYLIIISLLAFMVGRNFSKIKTLELKLDSLEDECKNLRNNLLKVKRNEVYNVKIDGDYIYDFNRDGTPRSCGRVYFLRSNTKPMDFTLERAKELAKQYDGDVYGPDGKVDIE